MAFENRLRPGHQQHAYALPNAAFRLVTIREDGQGRGDGRQLAQLSEYFT